MRTITYVENKIVAVTEQDKDSKTTVNLISIYYKSKTASISNSDINVIKSNI